MIMETFNEKEFQILNIIEQEEENISQRKISNDVGLSLGMVNLFLKKLANKGFIKIKKTSNKRSLKYILTAKGFKERLNYNLYYLKKNISHYSTVKEMMIKKLDELSQQKIKEIYIYGIDDWAEIIYLAVKNFDFILSGFVVNKKIDTETKFNVNIYTLDKISNFNKEIILLANIEHKNDFNQINNKIKNIRIIYF